MRILLKNRLLGCCGNAGGLRALLTKFRDYAEAAPDEVSVEMICPLHLPVCMQMLTYKGPIPDARAEARKWRAELGRAAFTTLKVKSYFTDLQAFVASMDGARQRQGYSEHWASCLANLPDAALDALARAADARPRGW